MPVPLRHVTAPNTHLGGGWDVCLSSFHGKRAEPFLFSGGDHSGGMSAEVWAPPPSTLLFCAPRYMSSFRELASKSPRVSSWWFDPIRHCFPRPCPTDDPPRHGPSPPPLPTWVSTPLPQFALSLCQSSPRTPHHVLTSPSGLSLGPFLPEAFLGLLCWIRCPHKHTAVPTFSLVGVIVIYFCML